MAGGGSRGGVWARARNRGLWSVLWRYGLEPLWPALTREGRSWLRSGFGSWPGLGWFSVPPWVRLEFARHQMAEKGRGHARRLSTRPVVRSLQRNLFAVGGGDWARWHLATPRGLWLSHPFQDPRLVCFALGLPASLRSAPGERKPLLAAALRGVLPEAIRTRRDKRGFDDVYGAGLARNAAFLEGMVLRSPLGGMGVIDAPALARVVREASLGVGDLRAHERMDKTLALVAWFARPRRSAEPGLKRVVPLRAGGHAAAAAPRLNGA